MNDTNFITPSSLQNVLQIKRPTIIDDRGFFRESVRTSAIEKEIGTPFVVVQANHARSTKNTLRGIHSAPWNKLIYVPRGIVQSVIVDLRKDSPTFGKHESFIIGEEDRTSIFVPAGCGNAYLVLSDDADYTYLTDQEWTPDKEYGIAWDDPTLGISWKFDTEPILSERDKNNLTFQERFH
ncbi:MAG: dTDP-4-dehydrorhamnose 3,5-epimerase family protein [Candidatus Levyibacteriota bacterium]